MTTIRTRTFAAFAILAAAAIVSFGAASATAETLRPTQAATAPNGFPAARCSRPADEEALRIKQLAEFVQKSRAMVEQNPLLWADVCYYEAELAASRRCLQSVAAR
jgi:hypothetical protein